MVLIVVNGNSERQLFVIVAEFGQEKCLWFPPRVKLVMSGLSPENLYHVISLNLSRSFDHEIGGVVTEAEKLTRLEVRRDLKLDDIICLFNLISPYCQKSTLCAQNLFGCLVLRQCESQFHLLSG